MGKLIMWNLVSLDGYFDGPKPWDLDWHGYIWGDELERLAIEQLRSAESLVFGRRTYEGMAAYWTGAADDDPVVAALMNRIPKLVFSRTLTDVSWSNASLARGEAVQVLREAKRKASGDLFVFGSADLSETLIKADLYDEYRIAVVPALLGQGRRLFGAETERLRLTLLDSSRLATGGVVLRYARQPAS